MMVLAVGCRCLLSPCLPIDGWGLGGLRQDRALDGEHWDLVVESVGAAKNDVLDESFSG